MGARTGSAGLTEPDDAIMTVVAATGGSALDGTEPAASQNKVLAMVVGFLAHRGDS